MAPCLRRCFALAALCGWAAATGCVYSTLADPDTKRYRATLPEAREAALRAFARWPCPAQKVESSEGYCLVNGTAQDGHTLTVEVRLRADGMVDVSARASGPDKDGSLKLARMISDELQR